MENYTKEDEKMIYKVRKNNSRVYNNRVQNSTDGLDSYFFLREFFF